MTYKTNEGKTYAIVGTIDGTITSASGVVIASFTANKQAYFTAPDGGYVTISDETAIVTPVFKLAPAALVGESGGGDTPAPGPTPSGDYGDYIGYIEYDDETGAIVDLSIPKYTTGNVTFQNEVFPENYEWKFDMPYLTNGDAMFYQCANLTSFSGDLPNLTNGQYMFQYCTNLTLFSVDLSNLINGDSMFNECTGLTEWNAPLSALTNGNSMFANCLNFTSFSSDLPNLTKGNGMFYWCKLDAASVERILSTIPTYIDGSTHQLDLHFSSEAASKFEEITGVTPTTSEQTVSYKGWTIQAMIYG